MDTAIAVDAVTATLGQVPDWGLALLILFVALGVAKAVDAAAEHLLKRNYGSDISTIVLEETHMPVYVTALLLGIYFASQFLVQPNLRFFVTAASLTAILLIWARAAIRLGNRIADHFEAAGKFEFGPVLANVWIFFVLLASFFAVLGVWRVDLTPFLASAGIIGIIIGFAAQDTISNFAAGVSLYSDRTFAVGDVISLPSGERGTVVDISIRSTTILTRDNTTVTIPNAEFNRQQVMNESAPQRRRRVRMNVGVAYGSDLDSVEEALLEVAEDVSLVLENPQPVVRFRDFENSAIRAQLQCYIQHPSSLGRVRDQLIRGIDRAFKARDIKIPFPQRELTFFEAGNRLVVEDVPEDA